MLIAPAYTKINPSFTEPGLLVSYSQVSQAFEMLPGGKPEAKLGAEDLAIYMNRVDLRNKVAAAQSTYNMLPSVDIVFSYISTPTYRVRCRVEYDGHDINAAGQYGASLQQLYRAGMWQAHFQFMRTALISGINPAFGEGLINAAGATTLNLPPDSNGHDTLVTYDNGELGQFFLQLIGAIKTRTNNIGTGRKFVFLSPQRVLQQVEYNIVQLVQFQREGAGTESTAGMVKLVGEKNEDEVLWGADDTLIGKGAGGTDLVIIVMPEIETVDPQNEINTNEFFNEVSPKTMACTAMYTDMVAPREITAPLPAGAVDCVSEHRITSGWPIRPESITLLSIQYQ
jgi:hypothetical protein